MKTITKRMILKGSSPCIVTLSGGEKTNIEIEWLKGRSEDPLYLFCSPEKYSSAEHSSVSFPIDHIRAAGIGTSLHTKGQFGSFDWSKAQENIRLHERSYIEPPKNNAVFQHTVDTPVKTEVECISQSKAAPRSSFCPCANTPKCEKIDPFPAQFPNSSWMRHEYSSPQGSWHYLTGNIYENGKLISTATAVPGKYNTRPPAWLKEFSMFLTDQNGKQGYWIAVSPSNT